MKYKKITAALSVAAAAIVSMVVNQSRAAENLYYGDLDGDSKVSMSDLILMQKYISGKTTLPKNISYKLADVNKDGIIDDFDLNIMKSMSINGNKILFEENITETSESETAATIPFIESAKKDITESLPREGKASVLVIAADFPDKTYEYDTKKLEKYFFSKTDPKDENYPFESISSYYSRASKGNVEISGDVFTYRAENNLQSYDGNSELLAQEALRAVSRKEDISKFDENGNKVIDSYVLLVPKGSPDDTWWPQECLAQNNEFNVNNIKIGSLVTANEDMENSNKFTSVMTHEIGHCFGLLDLYKKGEETDSDGIEGNAGNELMDIDEYSDISAYSKYILGWYRKNQVTKYDRSLNGEKIELVDAQSPVGSCVVIASENKEEYFIIEYQTENGNNSGINDRYENYFKSGVRIYHINEKGNNTNLISLVNKNGDAIDKNIEITSQNNEKFRWYDDDGGLSKDTGLKLNISFENKKAYIKISE